MLEHFACFTAHYSTTATSREVPDRPVIFEFSHSSGGKGGGGGHPDPEIRRETV